MPTATVAALAPAKQAVHQPKQHPPPNSDFYELYKTLNAGELATVKRVRAFMEAKVAPVITKPAAPSCPLCGTLKNRSLAFFAGHGIPGRARVAEFEKDRSDNYKLVCHEGNFTQAIELALRADAKAPPMAAGLIRVPHGFAYFRCHRPAF